MGWLFQSIRCPRKLTKPITKLKFVKGTTHNKILSRYFFTGCDFRVVETIPSRTRQLFFNYWRINNRYLEGFSRKSLRVAGRRGYAAPNLCRRWLWSLCTPWIYEKNKYYQVKAAMVHNGLWYQLFFANLSC